MSKWDEEKLEQMTKKQNEYTKSQINYEILAQKYSEIMEKLHINGDVMPLAFKDVETAYKGKITEDMTLPPIEGKLQEQVRQKEQEREIMHIKHFSRSISHQAWFDFIDKEIEQFIEKYPEFDEIIIKKIQ